MVVKHEDWCNTNAVCMLAHVGECTHQKICNCKYLPDQIPGVCNCAFYEKQVVGEAVWICPLHGEMTKKPVDGVWNKFKVNRVEVIDWTDGGEGRAYVYRTDVDRLVEIHIQDQGRTMKVFIKPE